MTNRPQRYTGSLQTWGVGATKDCARVAAPASKHSYGGNKNRGTKHRYFKILLCQIVHNDMLRPYKLGLLEQERERERLTASYFLCHNLLLPLKHSCYNGKSERCP